MSSYAYISRAGEGCGYGLDDLKERQTALTAEIERWQDRISAEAGQLRSLLSTEAKVAFYCGFDVDAAMTGSEKGYSSLHDLQVYVESVGGRLDVRSEFSNGTCIAGQVARLPFDVVNVSTASATDGR